VLRRLGLEGSRILVICILIGRLLISFKISPYLILLSPEFRKSLSDRVSVMAAESTRISGIEGKVVCSVMLACRFAEKRLVFDPFIVGEYVATGRISQTEVATRASARNLRFETIDPRVEVGNL
jgi:hypothetical protein